jgi:hypothetical protein
MNRYSKILRHIGSSSKTETPKSSSGKKRTFEEYEAEQKKTEVDKLKEQTQQLTENINFLQNLVVNQHDEVYELRQQLKNNPIPQPRKQLNEGLLNEPPNVKNSDPLTPLDQNFVTIQQLNDHYQLFINRIQKQMATIGGGGETQFKFLDDVVNFIFVGSKNDLPTPVNGIINLKDNYTYFFTTTVDLQGNRLVAGDNTTILGGSSENCRIKSTGIATDVALLSSVYSLPMRSITLEAPFAINLQASIPSVHALDWFGVNFTNCAKVGIISSYNNFIMLDGAFLNSQDLSFNGTTGTVGFNQCLFTGNFGLGGTKSILNFPSSFICTRRIRVTVCSFIVPSGYTGITVQDGVTFSQPENFILQTCNFSGPGTKLGISTHTDIDKRDAFFEGNRGIDNSFVIGQYYMKNNATETTFASTDTYVKVAGVTTTTGATNSKFSHTDNRLTCFAGVEREYLTQVSATIVTSTDTICSLAIYDSSTVGGILQASTTEFECINGVPITVHITDVHKHSFNEYVEVHISNLNNTDPVTVTQLNVLVTQMG